MEMVGSMAETPDGRQVKSRGRTALLRAVVSIEKCCQSNDLPGKDAVLSSIGARR